MTDDKPARQRKTRAERAVETLQRETRIADRLIAARDKAKADHERLEGEAAAAIKRRDHAAGLPDLPPTAKPRQARKTAAAPAPAGGAPDATTE